jgi:membrane-associated protein
MAFLDIINIPMLSSFSIMPDLDTSFLINLIQIHGYLFLFFLMILEGPVITMIAGFIASFGILNIHYLIILATLGNFIPDLMFFSIGKFSRIKKIENFLYNLGMTKARMIKIERNLKKHPIKSIVIIKLTPILAIPGIIVAGFMKSSSLKKFAIISLITNIISAFVFLSIGFYSGAILNKIMNYFRLSQYFIFFIILAVILAYILTKVFYSLIIPEVHGSKKNE